VVVVATQLSYALLKKALTNPTDNTTQKLDQRTREDSNGCRRGCVDKRKGQGGGGERWRGGMIREGRGKGRETSERREWGIEREVSYNYLSSQQYGP